MQSKITQKSPTRISAEVTVDWDKAGSHFDHSIRELRAQANIPGFRKGKAPTAILKRKYLDEITQDMARKLVPDSIAEVAKDKDIKMVGLRHLHRAEIKENVSFIFEAEIDVIPEFELSNYTGIEVESLKISVDDEAIQHDLKHMLEHGATDTVITDRGFEAGDVVKVDLTVLDQDAAESLLDVERYEIRSADKDVHPVLLEMLQGMALDDFKEHEFTGAEDDSFVTWRGKNIKAFMELKEIAVRIEPTLDDAFAKAKGFDSLDALKKDIADKISDKAEKQERDRLVSVVLGKLVEKYDFEVPESMVIEEAENQLDQQLRPFAHLLKQNPLDRKTMTDLFQGMIPQAEQMVRLELVLNKVADDMKIETPEDELEHELGHMAEHEAGATAESIRAKLEADGRLENIKYFLRRKKAVEALMDAAKVTKVDSLTEAEPETDTEAEPEKPKKKAAKKKPAKKAVAKVSDTGQDETLGEDQSVKPAKKKSTRKKATKPSETNE